jgi:large subunit ribosomal protein L6
MSRIGKRPVVVPQDVEVKLEGDVITVKGPKGQLSRRLPSDVTVTREDDRLLVSVGDATKEARALQGLVRILVGNMVTGVTDGFEKALEIVGVGYRAELQGKTAVFNLGYSHPIHFQLPDGIDAKIEKTKIVLSGADKELLGETAAKIRGLRRPEPYKGKGIRFADEFVRRKAGKAGAK